MIKLILTVCSQHKEYFHHISEKATRVQHNEYYGVKNIILKHNAKTYNKKRGGGVNYSCNSHFYEIWQGNYISM